MAHGLRHLHSAWAVEKEVTEEKPQVVLLRFGHDYDPECKLVDEVLLDAQDAIKDRCSIFLVDISEVPDFSQQFELYDPCTLMFFYRGRHLQLALGLGERYKITWSIGGRQELIDIVEAVQRGAQQGRDLIVASQDLSLAYRY
eukprot:TRINITY_DN17416_c0_g1_i1.p1 TRINITY_DN17416_c0_g1~~TRINITY_DN17416_c0_g1_i1.p1  ORF type:complete len:150 (+),score=21.18 TRINITY_DN17416_c0_g1_i1:22-450(+)